MDKIIATFNAYNEDDVSLYANAARYRNALIRLDEYLRKQIKYVEDYETVQDELQDVRDLLRQSVDASFWD